MAVDGHVLEGDDFFCLVHSWEGRVVGLGCHSGVLLVLQKLSELVPVYPSGGVPGEHEAEYGPELGPVAVWVGHRFGDVLDVDHLALFRREVDVSQAALVVD